jgi:outer membrane receptor protein involved in Fe transport
MDSANITPTRSTMLLLAFGFFAPGPAFAAEKESPLPDPAGDKIIELQPFEVAADTGYYSSNALSATRVRFAVSDLPTSIQVITGELLEDLDVSDLGEALRYANNVTRVDDGASQSFVGADFQIRGFQAPEKRNGMESFTFVNSNVIERIEIPKGPQSVLYGQANPGGVVNLVTKRPYFVPFSAKVNGMVGADDFRSVSLDAGGAASKTVAWRLVTSYNHAGGFQEFQESIDTLVFPSLAWKVSDKILLNFSFEWLDRAQTEVTRPMTFTDLGLASLAPAPDGTPAAQLGTAAGAFQTWQATGMYRLGSDPRINSLQGPLNRDKGYGQFSKTKIYYADLNVNLVRNLDLRVAAQRSEIDRHSHTRMADVLNFRAIAKTGTASYRHRKRYQDAEADEIQADLVHKLDFTLPFLGKSSLSTLVGAEWQEIGDTDGAVETALNSGKVIALEHILPEAFQSLLQINNLTRQDLVNRGSELVSSSSAVDPRREDLAPDSAFLTNGLFTRGNIDRTESEQKALYVNEIISLRDNRIRLMGGLRRDENKYAGVSLTNDWALREEGRTLFDSAGNSWSAGTSITLVQNKGFIDSLNAYASTSTSFNASNTRALYRIAAEIGEYGVDNAGVYGPGYVRDPLNPDFPFRAVYKLPEATPLGPETGKGLDIGVKFGLWQNRLVGSIGYFQVERNGIVRNTYMLKPIDASRYIPATFNPANPPVFVGLTGLTIPTLSGQEESSGFEFELNFRPTRNWDIYLGVSLMSSEVLSNDQDVSSIGRPLPFTPDDSANLVVKYTFTEGVLKKLSLGAGLDYWSTSYYASSFASRYSRSGPETIYSVFATYEVFSRNDYKGRLRLNIDNLEDTIYADKGFRWGQPRTVRGGFELSF